ncbi:hypothetical protein E2C01_076764 [Portunus trituberculatus]|uniref:Uncharacterized protein n=1 Tax=Portunus trituberculatus TaxID=210409 RepID=A0A5B7IJG7_PORTR|nr:hypothetical protein [Portunus trituberculatus]
MRGTPPQFWEDKKALRPLSRTRRRRRHTDATHHYLRHNDMPLFNSTHADQLVLYVQRRRFPISAPSAGTECPSRPCDSPPLPSSPRHRHRHRRRRYPRVGGGGGGNSNTL